MNSSKSSNYRLETLSCQPSKNVSLLTGTTLFTISTQLVGQNNNIYFTTQITDFNLQLSYNQSQVVSNVYIVYYYNNSFI